MSLQSVWSAYFAEDFDSCYVQATEMLAETDGVELLHVAGLALLRLDRFDEGLPLLKSAVRLMNAPRAYQVAARVLQELQSLDEADYFIERGLIAFPNDNILHGLHGNGLLMRGDVQAACAHYRSRLDRNPDDLLAMINLAMTLSAQSRFFEAEQHFLHAMQIVPTHRDILLGLAAIYGKTGRIRQAITILTPIAEDVDARYMLSLFLLTVGDYERGWALHYDRWDALAFRQAQRPPRPVQSLAEVDGRSVVVVREGGYGDLFQFMRYIPLLAARAQRVLLHVTEADYGLLASSLPSNVMFARVTDGQVVIPPEWDFTVALLDLPYLFRTTLDTIPTDIPYIRPRKAATLPPTLKRRVGLTWAGGAARGLSERSYDHHRSIAVQELVGLASVPGIEFYNLQLGAPHIPPLRGVLSPDTTWEGTAGIVSQMDLVITVDTAMVHLAGAMGIPTWLLSRYDACWRWLQNQSESAWYPKVRVFGQRTFGDWSEPVAEVTEALQGWLQLNGRDGVG